MDVYILYSNQIILKYVKKKMEINMALKIERCFIIFLLKIDIGIISWLLKLQKLRNWLEKRYINVLLMLC